MRLANTLTSPSMKTRPEPDGFRAWTQYPVETVTLLVRAPCAFARRRRIEHLFAGTEGDRGRHDEDNRLFVDGCAGSRLRVRLGVIYRQLFRIGERTRLTVLSQ
jgi:hypothetical protein